MHEHHEHGGWGGGWGNPRWGGGWGGGGWGGGGWGGGWGGPYIGRRMGYPLLGGSLLGGFGGGNGLMGDLLAGGVGYLVGRNTSQNQPQYTTPQYQQYPQQYQQPASQYQQPYQPTQGTAGNVQDNRLAQLNLLGQLRAQGTLSEAEFQAEKQKILNG